MYFTCRAIFLTNGNKPEAPVSLTYSIAVVWDSVWLAFLVAELNEFDVMACDIGNAYPNVPCKDNIWFKSGTECSDHQGKVMILVQAIYGLKTSGETWRLMFKDFIEENLNFKSTKIDHDVYIIRNRRENGTEYYELFLVYVYDVLAVSHSPESIIIDIG